MLGSFGDNRHEFCARAHVFGGHVHPAEAVDRVAEVEHRITLLCVREHGADREVDHGLSSAPVETGRSILQGHGGREPQGVRDGIRPAVVLPQPGATERLAEASGMDGDTHDQARAGPGSDEHLFVRERDHGKGVQRRRWLSESHDSFPVRVALWAEVDARL